MKTLFLQRHKEGRIHNTCLRAEVPLHIDIIEKLYFRCLAQGVNVDIDRLIDTVRERR